MTALTIGETGNRSAPPGSTDWAVALRLSTSQFHTIGKWFWGIMMENAKELYRFELKMSSFNFHGADVQSHFWQSEKNHYKPQSVSLYFVRSWVSSASRFSTWICNWSRRTLASLSWISIPIFISAASVSTIWLTNSIFSVLSHNTWETLSYQVSVSIAHGIGVFLAHKEVEWYLPIWDNLGLSNPVSCLLTEVPYGKW